MAVTEQLQVMVSNLRAECGHSLDIAQGKNQEATLKYLLKRTQYELWTAFIWPDLIIRAESGLAAGQYQYTYPTTMPFDNIREVWTVAETAVGMTDYDWLPVEYGISQDKIAPGGTNSHRADPVQFWDVDSTTMFRVWPTPDSGTGVIRFIGQKPLAAFTADADVSTLDSTVIVLFAAADLLARAKAEDAPSKQQKAQRHLTKLLANKISAKVKIAVMGGGSPARRFNNGNDFRISG